MKDKPKEQDKSNRIKELEEELQLTRNQLAEALKEQDQWATLCADLLQREYVGSENVIL